MRVLTVSITEAGRTVAGRLPFPSVHGELARSVREHWDDVDGFVLVAAAGACVRVVAPLLVGKATDPAVVCVDDNGRFAIALLGGHAAGANDLARQVASLLGAAPVVTTATDSSGVPAIDDLPGYVCEGDVAGVTAALLDGRPVTLTNPRAWPLPAALERVLAEAASGADAGARPSLLVSDELGGAASAVLRPPSLVAGIGASTDPPPGEIAALLAESLAGAALSPRSLRCVATIDRRAPALGFLGVPVAAYTPAELATVEVPNPSEQVRAAVGTPSVAEAAALREAGPGAELVVAKRRSPHATVAIARARRPRGRVAVVGLGPGAAGLRTPDAETAILHADVVIGYEPYVAQCRDLLGPAHDVVTSPIGAEVERARTAVARAGEGARVAVVCSGDPGVYAMASLVLEEAAGLADVTVVPGVTAALAAAALLGAPLGHDHMVVSLSDLLTPFELISSRVVAARDADLVLVLYNPRSKGRQWQLEAVRRLLLERRAGDTPVGIASDVGRPGASTTLTTLAELDPELVGMTTCVIIGSSATKIVGGRMVTPRGYST